MKSDGGAGNGGALVQAPAGGNGLAGAIVVGETICPQLRPGRLALASERIANARRMETLMMVILVVWLFERSITGEIQPAYIR